MADPGSLEAALNAQALRNERSVSTGSLVTLVVGVLLVGLLILSAPPGSAFREATGPAVLALSLALVGWHLATLSLLGRGKGARLFPWINSAIEASFPSAVMLIELQRETPGYVAYASMGPMIFAIVFVMASLRLRWQIPLMVGLLGACEYAAILAWVIPKLDLANSPGGPSTSAFLYVRPMLIGVLGGVAALINRTLRASVRAVHGQVRQQELFGKYKLGSLIAAGGMGEVVRAMYCPEGGFQKPVAIKRINAWLANDPRFVDAFRNEAELCSRLTHANIVQVLDFGQEGGSYFLAMEYVEGASLLALLKASREHNEQLAPSVVANLGRKIAAALAFAHTEARDVEGRLLRVIHRDLSPGNVLVSSAGEVKVTDFGIAKILGAKDATQTQTVAGKLSYMAPEQAMAEPLDERGDLFALGIVLWEALCLRRLFSADTDAATLLNVLNLAVPAPSLVRPELAGSGWDEFFSRALARPKADRFQTAAELSAALQALVLDDGLGHEELAKLVARVPPACPTTPAPAAAGRPEQATQTANTVSLRPPG